MKELLKVVVVEDEEIIRRGLVVTVDWQCMGAEVVGEAADGLAALDVIAATQPDVVLTDIRMPRLDGLGLASRLHQQQAAPQVVFLTSYADFDYAQQALRLRAADYLLKPVEEEELAQVLARIAAQAGTTAADPRSVEPAYAAEPAVRELLDIDRLLAQSRNTYVQAILRTIKERYAERMSLEDLAAEQQISVSYLSRKLREATGHTFGGLLARYRLQRSMSLLAAGRLRVYEVAEQTGFGDYRNLTQTCRKYLQHSPRTLLQDKLRDSGEEQGHESE